MVVVSECAGGEMLVGGDGGGCKPACVRGDVGGGGRKQVYMREGRCWGDGGGGHKQVCGRGDVGGGKWWWWSRVCVWGLVLPHNSSPLVIVVLSHALSPLIIAVPPHASSSLSPCC